jgi:hypothetical protein
MTKPKWKHPSETELRVFLRLQIQEYLNEHPLCFIEAKYQFGPMGLARNVVNRIFPDRWLGFPDRSA